jgi:hypothetical protein
VSHDTISLTISHADGGGGSISRATARTLNSGTWCIRLYPPPGHGSRPFDIELGSQLTGSVAKFGSVRWGDISKGLDATAGVVVDSKLPRLTYDGDIGAERLPHRRPNTGGGMVHSIPPKEPPKKHDALSILSVQCAEGHAAKPAGKVKVPQLFRNFPLDAYR